MKMIFLLSLLFCFSLPQAEASPKADKKEKSGKTKFKSGREMNFDSQLVEGQIYRPDLSVVTGDTSLGGLGVLRLRTDLVDLIRHQAGGSSNDSN